MKTVCKQSEGVGVALKVGQVVPELVAYALLQSPSATFAKVSLYSLLARMTKRRIAHIMSQTRRAYDSANLLEQGAAEFGMPLLQYARHIVAERHAHTCHLKRVCQSVVYEDAARQRKHLSLVLHPSERSREDKAVVVALKFGTVVVSLGMSHFLPQAFVGYELLPVHSVLRSGAYAALYMQRYKSWIIETKIKPQLSVISLIISTFAR